MNWVSDLIFAGIIAGLWIFERSMRIKETRMIIAGIKSKDAAEFKRTLADAKNKKEEADKKATSQDELG